MKLPCLSLFCQKRLSLLFRLILYPLSFIPLFVLTYAVPAFSQYKWERHYGTYGGDEAGQSVKQTQDGGYIVAGWIYSSASQYDDVYLIKLNAQGDTVWSKIYGGPNFEQGYSVQQTSDGGFIVAGYTDSFGAGSEDVYLIKTDSLGDTLWTRTFGGASTDEGFSVQQTRDNGYIIAGMTYSFGPDSLSEPNVYLIKTDSLGDTLWTRTYGGADQDVGWYVQQTSDGGYIVAGWTFSFGAGSEDVYLIKTNSKGDTLWTRTYGGAESDGGCCVQQTSDSCYIVVAGTFSRGDSEQVFLIKTNANGDTLWTKTYGGTGFDEGRAVQETQDGGYVIMGFTSSFGHGNYDAYLIRVNAQGDTLWTRTYGGPNGDNAISGQITQDGGYIMAGSTDSFGGAGLELYVIKTDANGNVGVEDKAVSSPFSRFPFSVRPNPFTSFATIPGHSSERFTLYDISGRKVGVYKGDRIGEGLGAGVYFLRWEGEDAKPVRIVKVR